MTAVGQLTIGAITRIAPSTISAADARQAGYDSLDALLAELNERTEGDVYRIELAALRPDPRIALREAPASSAKDTQDLAARLRRLDERAADGPWTRRVLEIIEAHPGVRAGDLCTLMGQEKEPFKINVRKLKNLGLTESLEVGYRLSPRGASLLASLKA